MRYLAVFDWNGTLFDDMEATHIATNACLRFFGITPITREEEQALFTFPLIHFYEKMGVSADKYLENAEEVGNIFLDTYNGAKARCGLKQGTYELLEWLQNQNVRLIILSNNFQSVLDEDVARFKLEPYFDLVTGNADPATIVQGLSKQKRLQEYMDQHNIQAENTMIIGDSHEEADIAHRMGLYGLSISGGLLSPQRLRDNAKDHIIDHLDEVRPLLSERWSLDG